MTKIKTESLIGEKARKLCPICREHLFINKKGDKWCSECTWSNNEDLTNYMTSLRK